MDSPVRPEMVLKYLERDGVDDLGNPLARPMAHGRHKEIQSRVKHIWLNVDVIPPVCYNIFIRYKEGLILIWKCGIIDINLEICFNY